MGIRNQQTNISQLHQEEGKEDFSGEMISMPGVRAF